jgi:hypothetical protein
MVQTVFAVWMTTWLVLQVAPDRAREQVATRAEFDQLARRQYQGRFTALPNVMFAIDRTSGRVYYIDTKRYTFHQEFLTANYLTLERGTRFYESNYQRPDRRFLLGTIAYRPTAEKFTFEFWEGDLTTPELVGEAARRLTETFFAPLYFKPNAPIQEQAAEAARVARLSPAELDPVGDYVPLNLARAVGVLRVIERMTPETIIDRNEIIIFREPPLELTPLSGVVTTRFGTPLAHVNLLAKGWGAPNAYINHADQLYAPLVGRFVTFETREDGYTLRPADVNETAEAGRRLAARADLLTPEADLDFRALTPLTAQRKTDARRFGAKAANLGEVAAASRTGSLRGVVVPPGFSIPFFYYTQFIAANGLETPILEMLGEDRFNHDPPYRKKRLAELRARIEGGRLNRAFSSAVLKRTQIMFGDRGVFVRSSTNAEDLPHFSGAGLYTTVPNVRGDEAVLAAIKKVWGSIWNYEAYEARESAGINHAAVYPAVLIQEGVPAEAAGVLITTNPFDREDRRGVYLNAKRGLGLRVVAGTRVPEQIIYDPLTSTVRVLTRAGDDTMLAFDERGGVREIQIDPDRRVLNDETARRLARAALAIKHHFGDRDQDIEWVTIKDRIYIVQSRPYTK